MQHIVVTFGVIGGHASRCRTHRMPMRRHGLVEARAPELDIILTDLFCMRITKCRCPSLLF